MTAFNKFYQELQAMKAPYSRSLMKNNGLAQLSNSPSFTNTVISYEQCIH